MNIQIAICVPFMQGDIWVERLEHLGIEEGLKVYEYTRPKDLGAIARCRREKQYDCVNL